MSSNICHLHLISSEALDNSSSLEKLVSSEESYASKSSMIIPTVATSETITTDASSNVTNYSSDVEYRSSSQALTEYRNPKPSRRVIYSREQKPDESSGESKHPSIEIKTPAKFPTACSRNAYRLSATGLHDVCIIHSCSDLDVRVEHFISGKLHRLGLSVTSMNYEAGDSDASLFNDNLKTVYQSKKAILIFSQDFKRNRYWFECLFALRLHVHDEHPLILIPIVIGDVKIPDNFSVIQAFQLGGSIPWVKNLFDALTDDACYESNLQNDEKFLHEGVELLYTHLEEMMKNHNNETAVAEDDELYKMETTLGTFCFALLDQFMKDTFETESFHSEELSDLIEIEKTLCRKLKGASVQTQLEFAHMNSKGGLSPHVSQIGLNNLHRIIMHGCGVDIQRDTITVKWKSFEQNLLRSNITLMDIVNVSRFTGIEQIAIKFDKESHDLIEKYYGAYWRKLLIMFAERILRFQNTEYQNEMLIYKILIKDDSKVTIYETGKNLSINFFKDHSLEDFGNVESRLKTFDTWPFETIVKKSDLAEAGFIYSGQGDNITCYACNQILHATNTYISNAEKGLEHSLHWYISLNHVFFNAQCTFAKSLPNYDALKDLAIKLRGHTITDPYLSGLGTCESRLNSFNKSLPKLRCKEFAKAGFIMLMHESGSLLVQCFYCCTQISQIRLTQDPWIEHVRYSPKCKFVEDTKGMKFVEDTIDFLKLEDKDLNDTVVEFRIIAQGIKR